MRELGDAVLEFGEQQPLPIGNILSRRNLTGRDGVPYARRLRGERGRGDWRKWAAELCAGNLPERRLGLENCGPW